MKAKKQQYLWTVFTNHEPVAVVAATVQEDAWKIVNALYERNDLQGDPSSASVQPCTGHQSKKVLRQADRMGVGTSFLARLGEGVFMTNIGGLTFERAAA